MNWKGVMPAITTCFTNDLRVDYGFMAGHCRWLLDNGCEDGRTVGYIRIRNVIQRGISPLQMEIVCSRQTDLVDDRSA